MNSHVSCRLRYPALAAAMALALSGIVHAQALPPGVPPQVPNAGQLLQEMPRQPAVPSTSRLDLSVPGAKQPAAESSRRFLVRRIHIVGNTLLRAATLQALVAGSAGRQLTLADLDALADRISAAYAKAGYPLVRVYVPAQTLHDGVVKLTVVEARYGKVVLHNASTVTDGILQDTLAPLHAGQPVASHTLERSLLLLSDIPGARASSVIRPGAEPGTSDLIVEVTSAPRYTGTLNLDDYGNAYTGRARLSGSVQINGLLHRGDLLDFSATSSGGRTTYAQGAYRYLLNGQGATLQAGVSTLHYHLGGALAALDAHGSARVGSVALAQPIVRNTAGNLYGQLSFAHKLLQDDIGTAMIANDRRANVWQVVLAGDQRDRSGVTNFSLGVARGRLGFTDAMAGFIDRLTSDTQGAYTRYSVSVARLQQLGTSNAIHVGYTQQWASRNLDTSEQLFLGGPNTVRGYDVGVLAGSQGNVFTAEFRHDFSVPTLPGRWQASLFADTGHVQVYKHPFTTGANGGRISSAGIGLRWTGPGGWAVMASAARPIGQAPELLPNAGTRPRLWLQILKGFD